MTNDHRMTIKWLKICIHVYICIHICMYSVYKVDYRGAAAPQNTAAQSLKVY